MNLSSYAISLFPCAQNTYVTNGSEYEFQGELVSSAELVTRVIAQDPHYVESLRQYAISLHQDCVAQIECNRLRVGNENVPLARLLYAYMNDVSPIGIDVDAYQQFLDDTIKAGVEHAIFAENKIRGIAERLTTRAVALGHFEIQGGQVSIHDGSNKDAITTQEVLNALIAEFGKEIVPLLESVVAGYHDYEQNEPTTNIRSILTAFPMFMPDGSITLSTDDFLLTISHSDGRSLFSKIPSVTIFIPYLFTGVLSLFTSVQEDGVRFDAFPKYTAMVLTRISAHLVRAITAANGSVGTSANQAIAGEANDVEAKHN